MKEENITIMHKLHFPALSIGKGQWAVGVGGGGGEGGGAEERVGGGGAGGRGGGDGAVEIANCNIRQDTGSNKRFLSTSQRQLRQS